MNEVVTTVTEVGRRWQIGNINITQDLAINYTATGRIKSVNGGPPLLIGHGASIRFEPLAREDYWPLRDGSMQCVNTRMIVTGLQYGIQCGPLSLRLGPRNVETSGVVYETDADAGMFAAELWMDTPAAQTEKQPEAGVSVRQTALVGTLVHYMTEVETYGELTIESRECLGMVVRANADGSLDLRGDPVTWNFCTNKVPSLHGEARRGQYSASHEPGTWHHGGYKIVLEDHEEVQR